MPGANFPQNFITGRLCVPESKEADGGRWSSRKQQVVDDDEEHVPADTEIPDSAVYPYRPPR